ncbi:MAG: nucleotidyltransferase family protein [Flaviflexus sp.]|uniref:nucleotidyltransferase family protein n=1 Tax=Flaviflexus sp. TaxID=1969482 RepID=UPI003F907D5B
MTDAAATPETLALRELIEMRRAEFEELLTKYGASRPRLFGSVARGTADADSDIDILVEMDPDDGNLLMRASGLMEESRALFGRSGLDVFPVQLLKDSVSQTALDDAIPL